MKLRVFKFIFFVDDIFSSFWLTSKQVCLIASCKPCFYVVLVEEILHKNRNYKEISLKYTEYIPRYYSLC